MVLPHGPMFQCHIALVSGVLELTIQELQELTTLHNKHVVSLAAIAVTLRVTKHVVLWPLYPGIAAVTTMCKKHVVLWPITGITVTTATCKQKIICCHTLTHHVFE